MNSMGRFKILTAGILLASSSASLLPAGICAAADTVSRPEIIRVNEKRTNLLLFTSGYEALCGNIGGASEVLGLGTLGTTLSQDDNRYVLHTGRLFIDNGKQPFTISTRLCSVRVNPDAAVVIEVHPRKPVRVTALAGGQSAVVIKARGKRGQSFTLKPGEELMLADSVLAPEDQEPSDGLKRVDLPVFSEVRGLDIKKQGVPLDEFVEQEVGRQERGHKLAGEKKTCWARAIGHLEVAAKAYNPKFDGSKLASVTSTAPLPADDPINVLAAGGTEFTEAADGTIKLRKGTVFMHAIDTAMVETPLGQVYGAKDALFSVDADYNLMRAEAVSGPSDVWVVVNKKRIDLAPGREVLVTDHAPKDEEVTPADGVGRRTPKTEEMDGGLKVTYSDFSLVSWLDAFDHLRPLRQGMSANEKHILDRIERTAAVVNTLTSAKGRYNAVPKKTKPENPGGQPSPLRPV